MGSRTKQGGASNVLSNVIERIYMALVILDRHFWQNLAKSFMLSIDVAHAMHPNYIEKNDLTNKPILNKRFGYKNGS